jgi:hypothetical protein
MFQDRKSDSPVFSNLPNLVINRLFIHPHQRSHQLDASSPPFVVHHAAPPEVKPQCVVARREAVLCRSTLLLYSQCAAMKLSYVACREGLVARLIVA